jgi:phosphatidylglycerophosphatase A
MSENDCPDCAARGRWAVLLATGFGIGRAPFAPGTFGTLAAVPVYLALSHASTALYVEIVVLMFVIGAIACQIAGELLGEHDHPAIVWDEVVGYQITMFLAPAGWLWIAVGVLLFRLFDIWKPFPLRQVDRRWRNGFGTMSDDALAGIYACLALHAIVWSADSFGYL